MQSNLDYLYREYLASFFPASAARPSNRAKFLEAPTSEKVIDSIRRDVREGLEALLKSGHVAEYNCRKTALHIVSQLKAVKY
jgi:hypothetical protein